MSVKVFISYNRKAAGIYAYAIKDRIVIRNSCQALLDEDFIPLGADSYAAIEQAIHSSKALILIIHPGWFTRDATSGRRPVDDPDNWMRLEVSIALGRKVPVLPILLEGAILPAARDLPAEISKLSGLNAIPMSSPMLYALARIGDALDPMVLGDVVLRPKPVDARALLEATLYYPWNFLRLLFAPKRVALAFTGDAHQELVRSQLFLIISLVIFSIFCAPIFVAQRGMVVFLTVQAFMLWAMAFGFSGILRWSWRLVKGKERSFYRYLSLNSYYCAIAYVLGLWNVLAALGVVIVFERPFVDQLAKANLLGIAQLLIAHFPVSLPLQVATLILAVGNLLMLIWSFAFWGAYRAINEVGWTESAGAFIIASVGCLVLGVVVAAVQAGLSYIMR